MDGWMLILYLGALALITVWVSVYVVGLFCVGRWLAVTRRTRPVRMIGLIVALSTVLAASCAFLPLDAFLKSATIFGVWLLHGWPTILGFWNGMEIGRESDLDRWKQRTEEWLSEWEDPVPKWLRDELDN